MKPYNFDLMVIGSGPGGYVAAIRASQLGLKTVIFEKDKPGGVCLNWGCIPSKSLIHQAQIFHSMDDLRNMGITLNTEGFNYEKVYKKSRQAAETLSRGVQFLLKKNNITYIEGEAKIAGDHQVNLNDGNKFTGRFILIATGSKPREIPGFIFDEEKVLSSTGALALKTLPDNILILGAGAIGVEFAHIMNSFGVDVRLVEMLDQILPLEDAEVAEVLTRSFKRRKIKISVNTKALSMKNEGQMLKVTLQSKDGMKTTIETEKVLVAVGRAPNSENIGLENVGIVPRRGFIPVGDYYMTGVPGIYAIGDVINTPLLAHVASKEGEIAVEHMAGKNPPPRINPMLIPGAVYCEPQVGSFGYTEEKAKQEKIAYQKVVFPYRGAGKSVAIERPDGFVKVIYDPSIKEILGAHVVGAEATEIVHEILLAKTAELLPEDVANMIHAHPTLSETIMEAMRMAEGWAIHA